MALVDVAYRALAKAYRILTNTPYVSPTASFAGKPGDVRSSTALQSIFVGHQGRIVDKWLHYLPVYERYLSAYRNKPFRMLEIGVFKGGSLQMWREYFGEHATMYGIDIDPKCAAYVEAPNVVRIGSQDDPKFLSSVVAEMGGVDVILDDGSHIARHQRASFIALWPLLSDGGLYIIEDMHTSYWPGFLEGGYRRRGTAIEMAKTLVDEMHHWYHTKGGRDDIGAVCFHDSVAVIEKRRGVRPSYLKVGHDSAAEMKVFD